MMSVALLHWPTFQRYGEVRKDLSLSVDPIDVLQNAHGSQDSAFIELHEWYYKLATANVFPESGNLQLHFDFNT